MIAQYVNLSLAGVLRGEMKDVSVSLVLVKIAHSGEAFMRGPPAPPRWLKDSDCLPRCKICLFLVNI